MGHIDFAVAPKIGTKISLDGQAYRLVETRGHRRLDGSDTSLLVWESRCPVCDVNFVAVTGLAQKSLNRRCKDHTKPRKPISGVKGRKVEIEVTLS